MWMSVDLQALGRTTSTVKPVGRIGGGAMAVPVDGGGAGPGRERSVACSKAAMSSSQLVMLSSGFHVLPAASRPVQSIRTYAARLAVAHLKLEQLLHLVLGHARPRRPGSPLAVMGRHPSCIRGSQVVGGKGASVRR